MAILSFKQVEEMLASQRAEMMTGGMASEDIDTMPVLLSLRHPHMPEGLNCELHHVESEDFIYLVGWMQPVPSEHGTVI